MLPLYSSKPEVNPLYPGLNLLGTAWEVADPIVYRSQMGSMPYLAQRPLPVDTPQPKGVRILGSMSKLAQPGLRQVE